MMRVAVPVLPVTGGADEEPCCVIRRKRDRVQRPICVAFTGVSALTTTCPPSLLRSTKAV